MPGANAKLLVVDDEPLVRATMALVLGELGYRVRSADNGLSALHEMHREMPDILLSDLNMPGMSGFELFFGSEVPSGVAADAFYQKGTGTDALLHVLGTVPQINRRAAQHSGSAGIKQQEGQLNI
jgi:hypothetical protein